MPATGVMPTRPTTSSTPVAGLGDSASTGTTRMATDCPLRITSICTSCPGRVDTASTTAFQVGMATPFTATIESPAVRPACAAGMVSTTVATTGGRYWRPFTANRPMDTTTARMTFMVTPASRMMAFCHSGLDSNHRSAGMGLGPKGIMASGSSGSSAPLRSSSSPSKALVAASSRLAMRT